MLRRLAIAASVFVLIAAAIIAAMWWLKSHGAIMIFGPGEDRIALISVFLAAATLVITAVALVVALAAVVGYSAIKDAAIQSARTTAQQVMDDMRAAARTREAFASMYREALPQEDALTKELGRRDDDA
jgi:hypothetical protein